MAPVTVAVNCMVAGGSSVEPVPVTVTEAFGNSVMVALPVLALFALLVAMTVAGVDSGTEAGGV